MGRGRAAAGVGPGVVAVEPGPFEHDANGAEQLAQTPVTFWASGQRVIAEGLDDLKAMSACGTRVGVRRHDCLTWHSRGLTAEYVGRHDRGKSRTVLGVDSARRLPGGSGENARGTPAAR